MFFNRSTIISFVCLLFLFVNADCGSKVRTLPGYPGVLPFNLETGYISVGESELFYLFVESQGKPRVDPLIIYVVGGPGCSALNGFFYQIGPLQFDPNYSGGLPTLHLFPYTWTKSASVIFVDAPVGSGYSYSKDWEDYYISDLQSANQTHIFIRKWLDDHPEYITNRFVVGTDSYSGVLAPIIAQEIFKGNKAGLEPQINLLGIISGCPHVDGELEDNSKIPFAHQMALLSKNLYESAKASCKGNFVDVDPSNAECIEYITEINECLELINDQMVLAPKCATISPRSDDKREHDSRSLKESSRHIYLPSKRGRIYWSTGGRDYWCKNFVYLLSDIWANDKSVQHALHVREGKIIEWHRCNLSLSQDTYVYDVSSAIDYHKNLTSTGLQVLLYSGDHDMVVPHISTEGWISSFNLTVNEDWRPWFVGGQIAGYTMEYTDFGYRLTYATLKGSGHSPTEWKPRECYEMFERWSHFYPL